MAQKHLNPIVLAWGALGAFLLLAGLSLRLIAPRFAYEAPFEQMPILGFVAGYVFVAGIVTLTVPRLIRATPSQKTSAFLLFILLIGVAVRVMQLGGSTLLEDDYYRYLWDGAVLSIGQSPFAHAPADVVAGQVDSLTPLAQSEGAAQVLNRVNHPEYRTIYPPVLQAVFAASHQLAPFSLDGWRVVLLVFELSLVGAICAILARLGKSPLWVALYWWNPVVIKEVSNSAHMEPVLMLPVLLAVYAVLRHRIIIGTALLAIGAGIKLWPVILVGVVMRSCWGQWRLMLSGAALSAVILALLMWPIWASGLDDSSGFVAFSKIWRASSATILLAQSSVGVLPDILSANPLTPRFLLGVILAAAIIMICARPTSTPEVTVHRMFLVTAALYLLAPSQTPWYFLWIVPFLCIYPVRGLMLAGVTLPLHYLFFFLSFNERPELFREVVVWVIWVPVWGVLLWDAWKSVEARRASPKVAA